MGKRIAIFATIVVVLAAAYYFSPYWALHQMRSAAQSGQGDKLAGYVDFPSVRESMKSQLTASMNKSMTADNKLKDNPFAALGQMVATAMIGPMVDQMISPESLANMINRGKVGPPKPAPGQKGAIEQNTAPDGNVQPRISREYEGMDIFKVSIRDPKDDSEALVFVLTRFGWFTWKLTSLRMPSLLP